MQDVSTSMFLCTTRTARKAEGVLNRAKVRTGKKAEGVQTHPDQDLEKKDVPSVRLARVVRRFDLAQSVPIGQTLGNFTFKPAFCRLIKGLSGQAVRKTILG